MENALAIANYFLLKGFKEKIDITPMKLLKLTYIAHGWHLALTSKPLIEENVEAWQYGPVIPTVYQTYKKYKSGNIKEIEEGQYRQLFNKKLEPFLDKVWDVYKKYSGIQLSAMTHQSGTPWFEVTKGGTYIPFGSPMDNKIIEQHYKNLK